MSRRLVLLIAVALAGLPACGKPVPSPQAKTAYDHFERGERQAERGQYAAAVESYDQAIALRSDFAPFFLRRGSANEELGRYAQALDDYRKCVELNAKWEEGHNSVAWLLATCPEARFRDGERAVEHATRACELSGWSDADRLETLAAASAEAGKFADAVKWQKQALKLAEGAPEEELMELRERLRLYEADKPYRRPRGRP